MSAADLLLTVRGQDDRWLSMAPDRTYFEAKYQSRINRYRESFEIPFDNQPVYGTTGRCTITPKGDFLTGLTLRTILPAIYPTQSGEYVFPTPSSQVGANVYVNMGLTQVVATGTILTANTLGNHYFSIGAAVTLKGTAYNIFDLDGTYTISSIPTSNSFTCATNLAGLSYNGTVSTVGIACADVVSYFSTQNSNLWVDNLTNKTWQITGASVSGDKITFTTSAPSKFPVGSQVLVNLPLTGFLNQFLTVFSSTNTTFTAVASFGIFAAVGYFYNGFSIDKGVTWSVSQVDNFVNNTPDCIGFGNNIFVAGGLVAGQTELYSVDGARSWKFAETSPGGLTSIAFGNNVFVGIRGVPFGGQYAVYSLDYGKNWQFADSCPYQMYGVAFGDDVFVAVGLNHQLRSDDYGVNWVQYGIKSGDFKSVAFGYYTFVAVGLNHQIHSESDGLSWNYASTQVNGDWTSVAFGQDTFVTVGANGKIAYSADYGLTWTLSSFTSSNNWKSVTFGDGRFVAVATNYKQAYSSDNGVTWTYATTSLSSQLSGVTFGLMNYVNSPSDSVSLVSSPLQIQNRIFSSSVYSSISFANAADAAFWGFDARQGLTYSLPATPPWTLTQSGWITGFLPPSLSTYVDSVAHKLCKAIRIKIGKQTIKEFTGEYIELQNDLWVPYENKAILKLLNGTLDQTQSVAAREYYVRIPMGAHEYPLCALTQQQLSISVDFEQYSALSDNLNKGTGNFLDPQSYLTYNASNGILNGQPMNVQTTFSYQQYIFIVTYSGKLIVYDTTKSFTDPVSYQVITALAGTTSLFQQFCVLSGTLYIGLTNGQLIRGNLNELIQGNTSSFVLNNYAPTIGSLTGTLVSDFRYVYYAVSNTVNSNLFMTQYDTTGTFTSSSSYKWVDFTNKINSNVTGVYQFISTGSELIMIPQGLPGKLYTFQLNSNVQSQWYTIDYLSSGHQITEGVLIGNSIYFACDGFNLLKYSNSLFTVLPYSLLNRFVAVGASNKQAYSITEGNYWNDASQITGDFYGVTFGNGVYVAVSHDNHQAYLLDNGLTWTYATTQLTGFWTGVTFGNDVFIAVSNDGHQAYSLDNGLTWAYATTQLTGSWTGVTFGNNVFVAVSDDGHQAYSNDKGLTWTYATTQLTGSWKGVTFGNDTFVTVGSDGHQAYSDNKGVTWTYATTQLTGIWLGVTFGNDTFVAVGMYNHQAYSDAKGLIWTYATTTAPTSWMAVTFGNNVFVAVAPDSKQSYSLDNGVNWSTSNQRVAGDWTSVTTNNIVGFPYNTGNGFKNLMAMGNYIYCSSNSSTVSTIIQIDTSADMSNISAYKAYSLQGATENIFAHGPRYVYIFSHEDPSASNIQRFDPYGTDTTFQASIIADYESLPSGVPKPDKAFVPIIQTQKVTDMNVMDIHGPVKELFITGASSSTNVFQYSNLSNQSTLALTAGEYIVTDDVGTRTFLKTIQAFETHTSMPIRNVSVIPFEFNPESELPNGTVNFSRIRDQVFSGDARTVWARTYNILAIQGGLGGLIFNS